MTQIQKNIFSTQSFGKRVNSMFLVDSRRMFATPLFYIMLGIAFAMPILVLVMTSGFGGEAGVFTNTWHIIAKESTAGMMGMDMTTMMNINLLYFMVGIFISLFVSQDFSSGYSKNLFTVRARKGDYIVSKTLIGFIAGAMFLIAFFVGAVLGGSFANLSFELGAVGVVGLVMCMLAKIFLMNVFVAVFLLMSVLGKQRAWLSICLCLFGGMLMFMIIPMMTPLDSGIGNLGMCLAGGAVFAIAIGAVSRIVLSRSNLV